MEVSAPVDDEAVSAVTGTDHASPAPTEAGDPVAVEPSGTRLALVWLLGSGAVVARLWGHGTTGIRAAVLIGVLSIVAVGALRLGPLTRRDRAVAILALAAVGALLTSSSAGRFPLPLALGATALADRAMFGPWRSVSARADRTPATLALVALAATTTAWIAVSSNALAVALLALVALLVVAHRSGPIATVDRVVWAPFEALGRGATGGLTRVAETAGSAGRRATAVAALTLPALSRLLRRAASSGATALVAARRATTALLRRLAATAASVARAVVVPIGRSLRVGLAPANRGVLLASVFVAAVTAPIFHRLVTEPWVMVRGTNDIPGTLDRVRWMELWPPRIPVPHPGWSLAVKLVAPIVGEVAAVTIILAVATGAGTAVLVSIGRSRWDDRPSLRWPAAIALGVGYVVMENPAIFAPRSDGWWSRYLEAGTHARGQGYLPLHQWGTPTITMSMPFVFALFALLQRVMLDVEGSGERLVTRRRALLALTVVSTLVQPATTLAVVPAVPVYLLLSGRWTRDMIRTVAAWFMVPGTVVVLGQVWFLASKVSPWEQATWVWRPLWSLSYFGMDRPAYWTTLVFFAVCLWGGGRRYLADPAVGLSGLALMTALVPFAFFEQTGLYEPEGDLGVPALMAFILLFVSSLRFVLLEFQSIRERSSVERTGVPLWAIAAAGMLAIMVAAGVVDLLSATAVIQEL